MKGTLAFLMCKQRSLRRGPCPVADSSTCSTDSTLACTGRTSDTCSIGSRSAAACPALPGPRFIKKVLLLTVHRFRKLSAKLILRKQATRRNCGRLQQESGSRPGRTYIMAESQRWGRTRFRGGPSSEAWLLPLAQRPEPEAAALAAAKAVAATAAAAAGTSAPCSAPP